METKVFTFEEASQHCNPDDCWLIIDGKAYDVTGFLDDHPGGKGPMLNISGEDATFEFEDVGHSEKTEELMKEFFVGKIEPYTRPKIRPSINRNVDGLISHNSTSTSTSISTSTSRLGLLYATMPPFILAAAFLFRYYNSNNNDYTV